MTDEERAERIARARSSHEAKAEELRSAWQAHAELYNHAARLKADAARMADEASDYYALWEYLLDLQVTAQAPTPAGQTPAGADDGDRRPGRQGRRRKPAEKPAEKTAEKPGEEPGEGVRDE